MGETAVPTKPSLPLLSLNGMFCMNQWSVRKRADVAQLLFSPLGFMYVLT